MARQAAGVLIALCAAARAADAAGASEDSPLGCLRWQGHGGCDAITDMDVCLGSRDGRPWKEWEGFKIAGEPCAWCGGKPCVEGSEALCAPRDWVKDLPGSVVANCSAGFVSFSEHELQNAAAEGSVSPGFFEEDAAGYSCSARYAEESADFNDFFFTFSAASLEECKALCAAEDYCTGIEFSAEELVCRLWWHPIDDVVEAPGHDCVRRTSTSNTDLTSVSSAEAAARAAAEEQAAQEQAAAEEAQQQQTGAIVGGVVGGVAGAGLIGGLIGGLLGHTTPTTTTTLLFELGQDVTADPRIMHDASAHAASHWGIFLVAGFACAAIALFLFLNRSKVFRGVTLDDDDESPSSRAERGLESEGTPLRWPEWARLMQPLPEGHHEPVHIRRVPVNEAGRALLTRTPISASGTPPVPRTPPSTFSYRRAPQSEPVQLVRAPLAEPVARPALMEPMAA